MTPDSRVKIALDATIYDRSLFGGAIRYHDELLRGLTTVGDNITVLSLKTSDFFSKRGIAAQVVHTSQQLAGYNLFHATQGAGIGMLGVPTIMTIHDLIDELMPTRLPRQPTEAEMKLCAAGIAEAVHIIAISQATRDGLQRLYGVQPSKISVIHHGVSPVFLSVPDHRRQNTAEHYRPYLLHVGGREGYKNFVSLLQCYGTTRLRHDFRLIAVGSQKTLLPAELCVVKKYGLRAEEIEMPGYCTDEQLANLYVRAACVVLPSECEGFGLPLLEALACGTPVAISTAPALLEVAGGLAQVFEPHCMESMFEAIRRAVDTSDPEWQMQSQRHAAGFTIEKMVSKTRALYAQFSQ